MQPPLGRGHTSAVVETAEKDTVSIYFVNAATASLSPEARTRVLIASGIQPALLENDLVRVTAPAFAALWREIATELNDEFFGLDRHPLRMGGFAMLCHVALSCKTLEHALKRVLRCTRMLLDDVAGELRVGGEETTLLVINRIAAAPRRLFADETFLVLLHGLMCWLAGQRIPLTVIRFAHPRPAHAREYTRMFCSNMEFDAECTSIGFATNALARPIVQSEASLRAFLGSLPQSIFLKFRNEDSWTIRVRRRLRDMVGAESKPLFEDIAESLGVTPSMLRRRLESEGNTFQQVKDQLRNDMAIDLLCASQVSIDDIAARLGFHDASSFHRSFKRWNGVQPGEYRFRKRSNEPLHAQLVPEAPRH